MKTVQQIIKSIDRRTLLQAYLAIDKPKINVMETETLDEKLYREIKDDYKEAWNRFVESIITLMVGTERTAANPQDCTIRKVWCILRFQRNGTEAPRLSAP